MLKPKEIKEWSDFLDGPLGVRGNWVVGNVETRIAWPVAPEEINFQGRTFWIIPITMSAYPGIATKILGPDDRDAAHKAIMRLVSAICWVESGGAIVQDFTGGSLPHPAGRDKKSGFAIRDKFDFTYLPEVDDERALLALALMREGYGLNHPAYSFLTFYRVLESAFPDGRKRGKWMSERIESLSDRRTREPLAELRAQGITNIAGHLYESGRQAIAHARFSPVVDPDDPLEVRRLNRELPIISTLAELAIEEVFNVKTSQTVYQEHLYELSGFKDMFGTGNVKNITNKELLSGEIDIPYLSIRIRNKQPYTALERLEPVSLAQNEATVRIDCVAASRLLAIAFELAFDEERLHFDIFSDIKIVPDDATSDYARMQVDLHRFEMDYIGNGELQIVDTDTGRELSRKDAYLPMNFFLNHDNARKIIERWETEAARRESVQKS